MASHLTDKVSYIRGLMEGMKFDTESDQGKLLDKIVELLDDMAEEIGRVSDSQEELSEYVDTIDESLSEMEDMLLSDDGDDDYDDFDDDDEDESEDDEDDFECDGDCSACEGCGEDEDYDEDNIFVECICPNCKASFYAKEDELGDDVFHICPRCGARVHVVPDYEDDEEIPVAHLADETPDEDK